MRCSLAKFVLLYSTLFIDNSSGVKSYKRNGFELTRPQTLEATATVNQPENSHTDGFSRTTLKITMWVAVHSKVLTGKDRDELFFSGISRPPLAVQKMYLVAHIDPSFSSPKILKVFEANAQVDPDFKKVKM